MSGLFAKKYRIESTRLKDWDYSTRGYYFVTICTKDRICCLGDIVDGEMKLSKTGEIVADEWEKTEKIRKNIKLDQWQIMPNHIHGIILITRRIVVETPRRGVSTEIRWKPNILGSIVNQFKSKCTKQIRRRGYRNFAWQPRFYDHIIRDEDALQRIRQYIIDNPKNWQDDRNNPKNFLKPRSWSKT